MSYRRVPLALTLDRKGLSFDLGVEFRGLTISENSTGYHIILRAYLRNGSPVYAINDAEDPVEGLQDLFDTLENRGGAGMWRKDKFFKK
jgi:hypothetical protein